MVIIKCCQKCNERVLGCHAECKTYASEKELLEMAKHNRREEKAKTYFSKRASQSKPRF